MEAVDPTWHIFSNINLRAKFEPRGQGGATVNPETKMQLEIGPNGLTVWTFGFSKDSKVRPLSGQFLEIKS